MYSVTSKHQPSNGFDLTLSDSKGEYHFFSGNIIRLEAADNYTLFYFKGHRLPFVVSKVLKVYEELLRPYGFVRTHRSHLVNKQYIKKIDGYSVVMQDASVAPITQRKRSACVRQLRQPVVATG